MTKYMHVALRVCEKALGRNSVLVNSCAIRKIYEILFSDVEDVQNRHRSNRSAFFFWNGGDGGWFRNCSPHHDEHGLETCMKDNEWINNVWGWE